MALSKQCIDRTGTDFYLPDGKIGDRIQISPACDLWMFGDKYGTITGIVKRGKYKGYYKVNMDKTGSSKISRDNIMDIYQVAPHLSQWWVSYYN